MVKAKLWSLRGPLFLLVTALFNAIGWLDDIVGLGDNMDTAWTFIQTPLGNLVLIVVGLVWGAFKVLRPPETVPSLKEIHAQVQLLSTDIEQLKNAREVFYLVLYEPGKFYWRHGEGGRLAVTAEHTKMPEGHEALQGRFMIGITAHPYATVEQMEMLVMGKRYPTDWVSEVITGNVNTGVALDFPKSITPGVHDVKLYSLVDGKEFSSNEISISVPRQ